MLKNVSDLKVRQIRIYPQDAVPLSMISTKSCTEKLRELFSFKGIDMLPIPGKETVALASGEVNLEQRLMVINRIEIDLRRIILEVEGTSDEADEVFGSLLSVLMETAEVDKKALNSPLLKAEVSQCVVTLDFMPAELLSNTYLEFLNRSVKEEASNKIADASIRPIGVISEISYELKDKNIIDNRITMNPKQFTIAVRAGVPSESKSYLITSPFDSNTHFEIIENLNKAVKKGK